MADILGYTTINDEWGTLYDKELAKHDLLLEIYSHKGDCDWNPDFGSTLLDRIFQMKNDVTKQEIILELQNIIADNPLFELVGLSTEELSDGWVFNLSIKYLGGVPEEWKLIINEETMKEYQ